MSTPFYDIPKDLRNSNFCTGCHHVVDFVSASKCSLFDEILFQKSILNSNLIRIEKCKQHEQISNKLDKIINIVILKGQ